ncbi:MAG: glutathione synthase [Proteobacteria bacterium]|nr:glutathione synthase [Pseudomonadota bacterium]
MRILVILDRLDLLDLSGDTSYALMLEAARRGHEIWTCEVGHLGLEHDDPIADAQLTQVRAAQTPQEAFACEPRTLIPLDAFDVVLLRKDPPVDQAYLQATWLLERARGRTVLVNDPRGLRELNEHLAVLDFPELTPPTIVTRSQKRLMEFLKEQGGAIVVKPIEGHGGDGIFLVRTGDPNVSSIFETSTHHGRAWTMAQRYLPEAVEGDKRILLVDGEPIGALLRVPPEGNARGNLHVGGRPERAGLDSRDEAIVRAVAPMLESYGQVLVGLDVIGGRLTEINITSPTGIRHIEAIEHRNVAAPVIDSLERKAAALR